MAFSDGKIGDYLFMGNFVYTVSDLVVIMMMMTLMMMMMMTMMMMMIRRRRKVCTCIELSLCAIVACSLLSVR